MFVFVNIWLQYYKFKKTGLTFQTFQWRRTKCSFSVTFS
ncbi:unnamed protein product, partial [Vitis vinifera]